MKRLFTATLIAYLGSTTLVGINVWAADTTAPAAAAAKGSAEEAIEIGSDANFAKDVLSSKEPVFVDFFTTWCGPCKLMEPVIQKMAAEYKGKVKVVRMDAEKNPVTAEKYDINLYPSFCVFVNGKMAQKQIGLKKLEDLKQMLLSAHAI
ncbi:MAG TPA: thioredoxin domain-containing protein [Oculatellaceae cyanobacterium]